MAFAPSESPLHAMTESPLHALNFLNPRASIVPIAYTFGLFSLRSLWDGAIGYPYASWYHDTVSSSPYVDFFQPGLEATSKADETDPISWSIIDGSLPPGLSLGTPSGDTIPIEGTPSVDSLNPPSTPYYLKVYDFKVRLTDALGHILQDKRLKLRVVKPLQMDNLTDFNDWLATLASGGTADGILLPFAAVENLTLDLPIVSYGGPYSYGPADPAFAGIWKTDAGSPAFFNYLIVRDQITGETSPTWKFYIRVSTAGIQWWTRTADPDLPSDDLTNYAGYYSYTSLPWGGDPGPPPSVIRISEIP